MFFMRYSLQNSLLLSTTTVTVKSVTDCISLLLTVSSVATVATTQFEIFRSSSPEVLLGKGVLKICSKFTGDYSCRSAISIKLQCCLVLVVLYCNE